MGLNETLDRLAKERVKSEAKYNIGDKVIVNGKRVETIEDIDGNYPEYPYRIINNNGVYGLFAESDLEPYRPSEEEVKHLHPLVKDWAKDVFFQRMLKDINHGMSEPKIDELIDRSVMIATKLFNKLYK